MRNTSGLKKGNEATQFQKGTQKQKDAARKGGLKKAENARKQKDFDEALFYIANMQIPIESVIQEFERQGIEKDNRNYLTLIVMRMAQMAANGDVKSAVNFIDSYKGALERVGKDNVSYESCTFNADPTASETVLICCEDFIGVHKGQTAYFVGEEYLVHGIVVKLIDHDTVEAHIYNVYAKVK